MTIPDEAHLKRCQLRAAAVFSAGCFQGDIAREPLTDLDETSLMVLEAINETILAIERRGLDVEALAAFGTP